MQQYFAKNEKLELEDSDYHHIKNVMRMKIGDYIKIAYDGVIYKCMINNISNKVSFDVIAKEKNNNEIGKIICAFSLIKEQKLDYLLQKATEVGVNEFIPFTSNRSIIKINKNKDEAKINRWNRIVKEASEQSYQFYIPKINNIISLKDLINVKADVKILFTLNEKTKNIKKILEKIDKYDTILYVTGPEGGFDKAEEELLLNNGFISASLGSSVLRSETAPVVVTSIINYELGR